MPSEISKKALDSGLITKKQYDKLPAHLLDAIVKSKNNETS
jgi:predicted RNA-binding protein associated with RNAse of E/G family